MTHVSLRSIDKRFGAFTAVEDVSLDFPAGALTAMLGPSGCGKTTLLRMIAGLEAPSAGRILFDADDVTDKPAHERACGMVFQSFALFPHLDVGDNIAYALAIAGVPRQQRRDRARELLNLVRLPGLEGRRIGELSGGQRQRVAVARALAQEPRIFLLDEPMSALDAKLREDMQVELRLLQQRLGITTIVVTHDQREAMTMADRIVVLDDGCVVQVGTPQEVYHRPATRFVAGFIGKANLISGTVRDGFIETPAAGLVVEPKATCVPGAEVTLACRPEWLRVRKGASPVGTPNTVPARVTFVRDVGQVRELHVRAEGAGAGGVELVCELPFADRTAYAAGDLVSVELPPDSLRVFPNGRPSAEAA